MPTIRTPDQRLRVFVSSTLEELAPERDAARQAVEALHLTPVMFELGARPHPPRSLYRAYIEQSHVFIGIYWQSYGWVAPDMEHSGLEDEYRISAQKPRLLYVKEPAGGREQRLESLIERIESEGGASYRLFGSPSELAERVGDDLAHLLSERFEAGSASETDPAPLPVPATRLVGRDQAIEALASMLEWDDVQLVTLTGVGGIGKSRLAVELATRVREAGTDVFFVDLAAVTDPELLPNAIAAALGVAYDGRPLTESIADRLKPNTLLLLDNFEQIIEAASYVVDLLSASRGLKVLVTSRALLGVRGESKFEVEPLAAPEGAESDSLEAIASAPAVELFVDSAQRADADFRLVAGNAGPVAELCDRLDGLPLALELIAAYARLLPPGTMLERIGRRLDLAGKADLPERQRTLRTAIAWSHDQLDEGEAKLFARLAVFAGGWDLSAAQAVCGIDGSADVLVTLSSLVDKSVVRIDDRRGGEPRFRMLETVREFASEQLAERQEEATIAARHADYFADLCERAGRHLLGSERDGWLRRLDADYPNIAALGPWALEGGDPTVLVHAWASIWIYAWLRALPREFVEVMEEIVPRLESPAPETRAEHAWLLGASLFSIGKIRESRRWLRVAAESAEQTGDARRAAYANTLIGASMPDEADRERARELLDGAIQTFREIDWLWGITFALPQRGMLALLDGDADAALRLHRECLRIGLELGDEFITALAYNQVGGDLLFQGNHAEARESLARSAEICVRMGIREVGAYCLEDLAGIAMAEEDAALASRMIGAAHSARDRLSAPVWPLHAPLKAARVAGVRAAAGEEAFAAEYAAGAELELEAALELGLARTT